MKVEWKKNMLTIAQHNNMHFLVYIGKCVITTDMNSLASFLQYLYPKEIMKQDHYYVEMHCTYRYVGTIAWYLYWVWFIIIAILFLIQMKI